MLYFYIFLFFFIYFFYHVPLYNMMCDNKDFIIIIKALGDMPVSGDHETVTEAIIACGEFLAPIYIADHNR